MPLHLKTPSSLASFKSRLVLPFWYRLNQVVLAKRLLNRCSSCGCGNVVGMNEAVSVVVVVSVLVYLVSVVTVEQVSTADLSLPNVVCCACSGDENFPQ